MTNKQQYEDRIQDITDRAAQMKGVLLESVVDTDGTFINNKKVQNERLNAAAKNSVYEAAGNSAGMLVGTHSRALQSYCNAKGHLPSDELLASAHKAIENAIAVTSGQNKPENFVLEAAEMSTTDGLIIRDRMVALVLPVMLQTITGDMVTFIPGQFNSSEMFKVYRVAGSDFGDLKTGDRIDYNYTGRYSVMDQMRLVGTGDGTKVAFPLDTNAVYGKVYPLKKGAVKILHDRNIVATDKDGDGKLYGSFVNAGGTTVNVTGTVNYTTGVVSPTFSTAPANSIEIHIGFDVDIEKSPTLIPRVNHEMLSATMRPHEAAIYANTTLQALWGIKREFNMNADNMAMQAMRNLLAADKDHKILQDMYFYAQGEVSWSRKVPDGTYFQEHYETLKEVLLNADSILIGRTGVSGLVGIVGDPKACAVFRAMKSPLFEAASGYRKLAQPHYVGRVFGMWDLYEDPAKDAYTCLLFAKGTDHGQAGYVAGDAVPALSFKHPMLPDLTYKSTLWELAYRDLQPFDGRDYFMKLTITNA